MSIDGVHRRVLPDTLLHRIIPLRRKRFEARGIERPARNPVDEPTRPVVRTVEDGDSLAADAERGFHEDFLRPARGDRARILLRRERIEPLGEDPAVAQEKERPRLADTQTGIDGVHQLFVLTKDVAILERTGIEEVVGEEIGYVLLHLRRRKRTVAAVKPVTVVVHGIDAPVFGELPAFAADRRFGLTAAAHAGRFEIGFVIVAVIGPVALLGAPFDETVEILLDTFHGRSVLIHSPLSGS